MASRSTTITIQNNSSATLHRSYVNLAHGIWTDNEYPAEESDPGGHSTFENESDGFMTGDQGEVDYFALGGKNNVKGLVKITWENPYPGRNSYGVQLPEGLNKSTSGGSGDNASWTVTITDA